GPRNTTRPGKPAKAHRTFYEEGFAALNRGDYHTAVDLLGRAASETAFASDMINHAYTLALHRAGQQQELSDVAFHIANSLVATDPASALDYFQRALQAGLDSSRARLIAEIHEDWAAERGRGTIPTDVRKVAHLLTNLVPHDPTTDYIRM